MKFTTTLAIVASTAKAQFYSAGPGIFGAQSQPGGVIGNIANGITGAVDEGAAAFGLDMGNFRDLFSDLGNNGGPAAGAGNNGYSLNNLFDNLQGGPTGSNAGGFTDRDLRGTYAICLDEASVLFPNNGETTLIPISAVGTACFSNQNQRCNVELIANVGGISELNNLVLVSESCYVTQVLANGVGTLDLKLKVLDKGYGYGSSYEEYKETLDKLKDQLEVKVSFVLKSDSEFCFQTNGPIVASGDAKKQQPQRRASYGNNDICPAQKYYTDPPTPYYSGGQVGSVCRSGDQCAANLFCDFPSNMCGSDGAVGYCSAIPARCLNEYPTAIVCGCDGVEYSSECAAYGNGSDINANTGSCRRYAP